MDEKGVLQQFSFQKILTIDQLTGMLKCSKATAWVKLKQWKAYTSINCNKRYYTLPNVPVFDENGLWEYKAVRFSTYGTCKQTILNLITKSPSGLRLVEIYRVVGLPANSSYLSRIINDSDIRREKYKGRFIYFSSNFDIYKQQKQSLQLRELMKDESSKNNMKPNSDRNILDH